MLLKLIYLFIIMSFNVATRNFKIICVVFILFLLDSVNLVISDISLQLILITETGKLKWTYIYFSVYINCNYFYNYKHAYYLGRLF